VKFKEVVLPNTSLRYPLSLPWTMWAKLVAREGVSPQAVILRVAVTHHFAGSNPPRFLRKCSCQVSIFLFNGFSHSQLGEGVEKKNATCVDGGG